MIEASDALNFLNYNGYPASICVSVNEEVVHGIPSKKRILKRATLSAWMRDLSMKDTIPTQPTHAVGENLAGGKKTGGNTPGLFEGIKYAKAGHHLHEISAAIGAYAESFGCRRCPRPGRPRHRNALARRSGSAELRTAKPRRPSPQPGMTLAIEPMITAGGYAVDGWMMTGPL